MEQAPLIPLILSCILLIYVIRQSLAKRTFMKIKLLFSFLFTFAATFILVFYGEISKDDQMKRIVDWILLGLDGVIGLFIIFLCEISASKVQFNQDLFHTLDQTKFYVLIDKKNRVKEISTLFLNDLGLEKSQALRKNLFDLIETKYRIFSLNGTDASKNDLKIYYGNTKNISVTGDTMDLELHDDNGDVLAYYFSETPILVFGRFKGRLFVGDKRGSESLVGMEKDLAESIGELELIKSRFITVLEKTNEGIFFNNLTDKSIWMNDVLVHDLSLSGNSMSLDGFVKNVHPDDLAMYKTKMSQINNINPTYSLSYRFNTGSRYIFVKEEGTRITNGKMIELCGVIRILDNYKFEKTQTELDVIQGEPEMLAALNQLYQQDKVFQLVYFKMESIPKLNEKFGRSIGNMALSEYVKLIKNRFVDVNMIYRISGLEYVAIITDYRKMDMLKNALVNGEKLLHVAANYGNINVEIEAFMGISYSTDAKNPKACLANSKEALRFCSNPHFSSNYAYFKDIC